MNCTFTFLISRFKNAVYNIAVCPMILMAMTAPVLADVFPGRHVRNSIQELDVLDQTVVDLLSAKSTLFPSLSDAKIKIKFRKLEKVLDDRVASAYFENRLNSAEITILVGLHVGILQRRALGNESFKPRITRLSVRSECQQDLAFGRTFARYSRALSARNQAELFLVLMDHQNALNCLGGLEAKLLAHATGVALWQWLEHFETLGKSKGAIKVAIASIVNPALMVFDLTKYQGPSWLYYWFHRTQSVSPDASDRLPELYLNDFITGSLVSIIPRGSITLDPLIDPANIGTGACSLLEMIGAGSESGDFSCGRGLGCADHATQQPGLNSLPESLISNPGTILDNNSVLNSGSQLPGLETPTLLRPTTSYGIDISSLQSSCEGAGTGSAGIGQLAGAPGLGSFAGCLASTLAAAANDNAFSCVLRTSKKIAAEEPAPIIGSGARGLPVVRGVLGGSSCRSDPLAQSGGRDIPIPHGQSNCQTHFFCGKEAAAEFYRSQEGIEYTKQLLHDAADAWADRFRLINSVAPPPGGVNADNLSAEQQVIINTAHSKADDEAKDLAEEGAIAIEKSTKKKGLIEDKGTLGQVVGGTKKIEIEASLPDTGSNQQVHEHEGAHVILNLFFNNGSGSSSVDHHAIMNMTKGDGRWEGLMSEAIPWIKEKLDIKDDESDDPQPSSTDDGTQTPEPDEEYCSALTESMKELLACTNPIPSPFEMLSGPGSSSPISAIQPELISSLPVNVERLGGRTFLTPQPDDDIFGRAEAAGASMFSQCYDELGMSVLGVDKNGQLIIGMTNDSDGNQCGALDCTPPAVAKSIEGLCQCVGAQHNVDPLMRELGFKRLCTTSDACIPKDDFFSTLERALEAPTEPEPEPEIIRPQR